MGAGTVHHIAWASRDEDHLAWQARVAEAGLGVSDVRDRDYFQSIYFGEPRGILFEIATLSPGLRGRRGARVTSARRCACRSSTSTCARSWRSVLTPVTNPRTKELVR